MPFERVLAVKTKSRHSVAPVFSRIVLIASLRLAVCLWLALASAWAGEGSIQRGDDLHFSRIDSSNGLTHNTVSAITQDHYGFLWVGTLDGLNRYDGYEFVIYRRRASDPHSLPGNNISALLEDRSGRLWVGTEGGPARFDRRSDAFRRFALTSQASAEDWPAILCLFEDSSGRLWAAPLNGVYKIEMVHPQGQRGIFASWDAHLGLTNGGNPIQLHTGNYSTCARNDCDFIIRPIPGKSATYTIEMANPQGQRGIFASWDAHPGLTNGGNPIRLHTGNYSTCARNDCDFIISSR